MRKKAGTGKALVGIDEAGRGPLAGPMALGVVVVHDRSCLALFRGLRESKQHTMEEREFWFNRIVTAADEGVLAYKVTFASHEDIDTKGLTWTATDCISRALQELTAAGHMQTHYEIRLDGLLKAPQQFTQQRTIKGGDAREKIIAMASICAKVLRDRAMLELAKQYPEYGFDKHKGYGTKEHYKALEIYGPCIIHRRRFLKKLSVTL